VVPEAFVERLAAERRELSGKDDAWVGLREAAEMIGCHQSTVLRYVQRGDISRICVAQQALAQPLVGAGVCETSDSE